MSKGSLAPGETDGGWDAAAYGENARFVADLAASLVDWLAPQAGEQILDLGCGDGALTAVIAARGADVTGLDPSPDFVAATRGRGLAAVQGDGQALDYDRAFDAVFSNAALHWMARDPVAVIRGVYAALKPGGRFVAEFGVEGNVASIRTALHAEAQALGLDAAAIDPWYFPQAEVYLNQLATAGFEIERQHVFERPTPLPGAMTAWLTTLARPFVHAVPAAERDAFVTAVSERLRPELQQASGRWVAPYVRLRFCARRQRR